MIAGTPIRTTASPSDYVKEALDRVAQNSEKTAPNTICMTIEEKKKCAGFKIVATRLATKGNGTRIFARVFVNGHWTWRSTATDDLELAKKWLEAWERKQWLAKQGFIEKEPTANQEPKPDKNRDRSGQSQNKAHPSQPSITVNTILDKYVTDGHPTVRKRKIKPKAPRSIENEEYCLTPVREFFGKMDPRCLTLGDCDSYKAWRNGGGYVSKFLLRGRNIQKKTKGGDRAVDLELIVLSNALELAVRQGTINSNPIRDRGRYADKSAVRHCREVAPTPQGLVLIVDWLEDNEFQQHADLCRYLAYGGLRLSEGLRSRWPEINWKEEIISVKRSKKGVFPFVLLYPELAALLRRMRRKARGDLIFPAPFDANKSLDASCFRRRLAQAAQACGLRHVTPQGLRSYFVTQARQSGLNDAEIAQLIGDKTGPALIAEVYGDVRPDHLLQIARQIKLTARTRNIGHLAKSRKKAQPRGRK